MNRNCRNLVGRHCQAPDPEARRRAARPGLMGLNAILGVVILASAALMGALAHEGHAPLPTRGVEVNAAAGTVTLTREAAEALAVQTAEVVLTPDSDFVLAPVRVELPWRQEAIVTAPVEGRIARILVQPGDEVAAGQAVVEIESPHLQQLQTELAAAVSALRLSRQLAGHLEGLAGDVVTGRQAADAVLQRDQDEVAVRLARLQLLTAGFTSAQVDEIEQGTAGPAARTLPLCSPIAGRIDSVEVVPGNVISPVDPLVRVKDLGGLWLRAEILEHDFFRVRSGQPVAIDLAALGGRTLDGTVGPVLPLVDRATGQATAWIDWTEEQSNRYGLLPGMTGVARITTSETGPLMTVPAAAVARDGAERYVLVQQESGGRVMAFARRNIVVVRERAGKVQFQSAGVVPGDVVATTGAHELFNYFVQGVLQLSPEARENVRLRVAPAGPAVLDTVIHAPGSVDFPVLAGGDAVSARAAGRLVSIDVQRGQSVRPGDRIGTMDSFEFQSLQRDLIASALESKRLTRRLESLRQGGAQNSAAQRELWQLESDLRMVEIRLAGQRRSLNLLGVDEADLERIEAEGEPLRALPLKATQGGAIVGVAGRVGQAVQPGEVLVRIQSSGLTQVHAFLKEPDAVSVRGGADARVRLAGLPGQVFDARVVRMGQGLDPSSRLWPVWLEPAGEWPASLPRNLQATVDVIVGQSPVEIAVPHDSIVREGSRTWAFVQRSDGRFERRELVTGRSDDRQVEVLRGLTPGEPVAVWGAVELQNAYAALR